MNYEDSYAKHAEDCAHLSTFAWQKFRHLGTIICIQKGERLDQILSRIWIKHDENNFYNDLGGIS